MFSPPVSVPVPDWQTEPERLAALPAVVDIWRVRLAGSSRGLAAVDATSERDQARTAMMHTLAAYLGHAARDLVLERPARGKPRLVAPPSDLRFNLSHTRGMALFAIACEIDIGIDVEVDRVVPNRLAMARRVYPPTVVEGLERLGGDAQNRAFLAAWTAMEARQKAFGRGIFETRVDDAAARAFGFSPAPGWLAHVAVPTAAGRVEFRYFDYASP